MIDSAIARNFHFIQHKGSVISLHVPSMTVLDLHPAAVGYLKLVANNEMSDGSLRMKYSPFIVDSVVQQLNELAIEGIFKPIDVSDRYLKPTFPSLIWLHIAHACNMRCVYCFADKGSYAESPSLMSPRRARESIDWVLKQKNDGEKVHVLFFGGEPLINFNSIQATVEHIAKSNMKDRVIWGVITNGALLNEDISNYLIKNNFHVTISIDGPPNIQEHLRPLKHGECNSAQLEAVARYMITESSLPVSVRATITPENLDLLLTFDYFRELGFRHMSLMPALGVFSDKWMLQGASWNEYFEQLKLVADKVVKMAHDGQCLHVRPLDNYLEKIHYRLATGNCGAAVEGMAISPEGEVYPCSRFVGDAGFRCGHIGDKGALKCADFFHHKTTTSHSNCQNCWARHYCEGGCPYYNMQERRDFSLPREEFCEHHRKLTELSLLMYAKLAKSQEVMNLYFGEQAKSAQCLPKVV